VPFLLWNYIGAVLRAAHVYISGLTIGCTADVPEFLQVKEHLFRRLLGQLPYELEPVPTLS
jgi:hypothetical protein